MPQEVIINDSENVDLITALFCPPAAEIFFCGRENGSVYLHSTISGNPIDRLFSHGRSASIVSLIFDEDTNTLSVLDSLRRVTTRKIFHREGTYESTEPIIDRRMDVAVGQLLAIESHTRLLVCSCTEGKVWSISSEGGDLVQSTPRKDHSLYGWREHPTDPNRLILITGNVLHLYDSRTLERLTDEEGILLEGPILPQSFIQLIVPCFDGNVVATAFVESLSTRAKSSLLMWNTSDLSSTSKKAAPIPRYQALADQVERLVGAYGERLVFLHCSGWVCSADSATFDVNRYVRHFFIPADWLSTNSELIIEVSSKGHILFVKDNEVAVIKGGLEINEYNSSALVRNRPPLASRKKPSSPFGSKRRLDKYRLSC